MGEKQGRGENMKGLRPLHASPNGENRFVNGLKGAVAGLQRHPLLGAYSCSAPSISSSSRSAASISRRLMGRRLVKSYSAGTTNKVNNVA